MTTSFEVDEIVRAVHAMAERMHRHGGDTHHVASPLGAWLVLAIAATATEGAAREACERALGMDRDRAAAVARRLLASPHPAVATAMAVWFCDDPRTSAMERWIASLGTAVETGPRPKQKEADAWTQRVSLGMIDRFPLNVRDFDVILASALATRSRWEVPYETSQGSALSDPAGRPSTSWGSSLERVLSTRNALAGAVVRTESAGDVIVHRRTTKDGLTVVSVRALPEVPAGTVVAVAHEIASGDALGRAPSRVSLFDLSLDPHPLWEIREERIPRAGREEMYDVRLPCWDVSSQHRLDMMSEAYRLASGAILGLLGLPNGRWECAQAVTARYSRIGFEALALTTFGASRFSKEFSRKTEEGLLRTAVMRFNQPFAAVAVVTGRDAPRDVGGESITGADWLGLPVYSAWVAAPSESDEEEIDWGEDEFDALTPEPGSKADPLKPGARMRTMSGRLIELDEDLNPVPVRDDPRPLRRSAIRWWNSPLGQRVRSWFRRRA